MKRSPSKTETADSSVLLDRDLFDVCIEAMHRAADMQALFSGVLMAASITDSDHLARERMSGIRRKLRELDHYVNEAEKRIPKKRA